MANGRLLAVIDVEHDWAANKAEAGLAIWAVESARLYAGLVYILGLLDVQLGLITRESPQLDHYYFCTRKEKRTRQLWPVGFLYEKQPLNLSCTKGTVLNRIGTSFSHFPSGATPRLVSLASMQGKLCFYY